MTFIGFIRILVVGMSALVAASKGSVAAERADMATLVSVFDQMVLRDNGRVSKWIANRPLAIKVTAKFGERENAIVDSSIAVLGEHARLTIVRDDKAERPDLLIETSKTLPVHANVGFWNVAVTQSTWGRLASERRLATIKVIEDWYRGDPYRIHRTIPHELMHALGFDGHPQNFDSVLSLHNTRNSLSEWDLFFVRVLYDPKLPVGTPRAFALPLVCDLMHERLIAENNPDATDLNRSGRHSHCAQLVGQPIVAKTSNEELRFGWAYLRGLGIARNLDEAERWAQKAFASKDPDAQALIDLIEKTKATPVSKAANKAKAKSPEADSP